MPTPSSWNRREFQTASAGYFQVLRPNRWFSAARLPGGFRYALGSDAQPAAAGSSLPKTAEQDSSAQVLPLQFAATTDLRQTQRFLLIMTLLVTGFFLMLPFGDPGFRAVVHKHYCALISPGCRSAKAAPQNPSSSPCTVPH